MNDKINKAFKMLEDVESVYLVIYYNNVVDEGYPYSTGWAYADKKLLSSVLEDFKTIENVTMDHDTISIEGRCLESVKDYITENIAIPF